MPRLVGTLDSKYFAGYGRGNQVLLLKLVGAKIPPQKWHFLMQNMFSILFLEEMLVKAENSIFNLLINLTSKSKMEGTFKIGKKPW